MTWYSQQTGVREYDTYGRVFLPTGTALGNEFGINQITGDDRPEPSVASLTNGNAFVAWSHYQFGVGDIYGRIFLPNGTAIGNEFPINQITSGSQEFPKVASLTNGNVLAIWQDDQVDFGDIYGRVFLPGGTAIGNEFIINQFTSGLQQYPSAASLTNGNVLVVRIASTVNTFGGDRERSRRKVVNTCGGKA